MNYNYQSIIKKRQCNCGEWFSPTTLRNVLCTKCQWDHARRKRYAKKDEK